MTEPINLSDYRQNDPCLEALARLSRLGRELERQAEMLRAVLAKIKKAQKHD